MKVNTHQASNLDLQPYAESHRKDFVTLNCNEVARRYMNGAHSRLTAALLFDRILAESASGDMIAWAVSLKSEHRYIGHVFISRDNENPSPELGFIFDPDIWGQGLATAAVKQVVENALNSRGLAQITATTDLENEAAQRVLEKCGFQLDTQEIDEDGEFYRYTLSSLDT